MNIESATPANNGQRMSAEDRKQQLAAAALRVFSAHGYSGATTREIASVAGVSEAVIFQHFDSKEALYTSILEEKTSRIFSRQWMTAAESFAALKDDESLFQTIAEKITEFAGQSCLVRLILYSALEGHEIVHAFRRRQMLPVFEMLRDYIRVRQSDGAFQPIDASIAARAFFGSLIHHAVIENLFKVESLGVSGETAIRDYTRLALDGLRTNETERNYTADKK